MIATAKKSSGRLASRRRREKVANILSMALLILLGLIVMFPINWFLRSSLMSNGGLYAYPPSFTPLAWRFLGALGAGRGGDGYHGRLRLCAAALPGE